MKFKSLIIAAMAALGLMSCDNISEADRYLPVEGAKTSRKVLLTEFTGMKCVNCPDAAAIATDLHEQFPDNFIVVAMHPLGHGFVSTDTTPDLARQESMDYLTAMGGTQSTGLPAGAINFSAFDGKYLLDRTEWAARVVQQMAVAPDCHIAMTHNATDTRKHTISVSVEPQNSSARKASLIVWLVESGMVGPQASLDQGTIKDYKHNHALRECVTELWGDALGTVSGTVTKEYTIDIAEEYVPANCSVVAALIDTETHEVIQAEEISLSDETPDQPEEGIVLMNIDGNAPLADGDTVVVTSFDGEFGAPEAVFDVQISYYEEEGELTATEIRKFDQSKYSTSMCIDMCIPGDNEETQTWKLGTYYEGDQKQIQLHLTVDDAAAQKEAAEMTVDLVISDGTNKSTIVVVYKYTPAE